MCLEAQAVHLTMPIPDASGWIRIESAGFTNRVHILESSTNLQKWTEAAILHDGPFRFAEAGPAGAATRFFRALTRPKTSQDDGKNQICFPEDPFANAPYNAYELNPSARWVKFILLLPQPTRVWFQDSARYPFHYDYAVQRLAPFAGMSRAQFDAQTYHPFHHNFAEEFIFEPDLDPGLPADQLAALQAANIRFVYAQYDFTTAQISIAGWDGRFRTHGR